MHPREEPEDPRPLGQPDAPTTHLPGGVVGLDIGPALHEAAVLELLRAMGLPLPEK